MTTPILCQTHTATESTEDGVEARMRQALSKLGTAKPDKPEASRRMTYQAPPGAGRHRFRQDGEVPVIRISLREGSCGKERQAYASIGNAGPRQGERGCDQNGVESARQVQELTEQLRATQTRLGHAELAANEATRAAQAWQEEAASLRQVLDTAEAALVQVRAELVATERAREELERCSPAACYLSPQNHARADTVHRRTTGCHPGSTNRVRDQVPTGGPEPVKWWTGD